MSFPTSLRPKSINGEKTKPVLPSSLKPKQQERQQEEEGLLQSGLRTLGAAATGYASGTPYGIASNLSNLLALGDVNDPEEMERIREIAEREGVPFNEKSYLEAGRQALGSFPTPSNIARMTEEATGLPLTARTKLQKGIETAFTAGRAQPGGLSQKAVSGTTAAGTSRGLQEVGVAEPFSELAGFAAGGLAGVKTPEISLGKKTKPSGLPLRQYEKLKTPREISGKKVEKINETLESDFRKISEDILATSPIEETRTAIAENPAFKKEIAEKFRDVEILAESLPEKIDTDVVKKNLVKNVLKKKGTGFTPGEYEKDYRKFIVQFIKDTPAQEIGAADLVNQYRKNNKALSEFYSPQHSRAYNRAKKDAILEYNRAISEAIEKEYPNSEFSNLFKETNKQWANISDAESVNSFIDNLFEGGPKFTKGKRFFESENQARPFKRALGEENFKKFEQLMKDFISTEKTHKMLKVAKSKGFGELAKTAGAYILHPKIAVGKLAYSATKDAYNGLINSLLDKPQLTIKWKKAIDHLKNGSFEKAENELRFLKKTIDDESKEIRNPK